MSDGQDDSWAAMADRVKASVPGTQQYEQQHGVDEWHALAEQAKSHLPGNRLQYTLMKYANPGLMQTSRVLRCVPHNVAAGTGSL